MSTPRVHRKAYAAGRMLSEKEDAMTYVERAKNRPLKEEPLILGIESSCDETAGAVLKGGKHLSVAILSLAARQA